ncbi:MAG: undecaprenyl-diphosphate phosphatase [Sulfurospirillaceae bacterium]|nr:undecaprenyl-diphosphate phosphatase [Sulfurospirillaceae bacterium]
MDVIQSAILGVIEGFTEFLPISSTAHMIVASKMLGLSQDTYTKAFEIIIQLAAILAVVFVYKEKFSPKKIELWKRLIVAYLPLAVIGFIFRHQIKDLFSTQIVAVMFIVGGVIFLIVEKFYKEKEHYVSDVEKVTYKQSLFIGIAQVFALIPGTSRAGATIIGGLLVGLNRKISAEFSFLLAFPVMITVSAYEFLKHYHEFSNENILTLAVGFVVSFVVAYLTIKLFLSFLQRFTFVSFGIYRIIFGLILLYIGS